MLHSPLKPTPSSSTDRQDKGKAKRVDAYFSADVETDGPIPGPFSILSFALVYAGSFDGKTFERPDSYDLSIYRELKPISDNFQEEALRVNKLDRARLCREGGEPRKTMIEAYRWVRKIAGQAQPVLVAYPLSFDWSWLYWYFVRFSPEGSPFDYSRCFDKVRVAVVSASPSELERPPRTSKTLSLTTAIRCSARTTSETESPASGRG